MIDSYDEWGDKCYEEGFRQGYLEGFLMGLYPPLENLMDMGIPFNEACRKLGITEEKIEETKQLLKDKLDK